jgi:hypothetical protein
MVDKTNTPTLEELEAQFPYDPETTIVPTPPSTPPPPIDFSAITVFELYDWNAFTMKLPHISFKTLHFIGKFDIDGKTITYYTGPLQLYNKENDWYESLGTFQGSKPYRLTGTRNIDAEFPQSVINGLQATEIMLIDKPDLYRFPHFSPSEETA